MLIEEPDIYVFLLLTSRTPVNKRRSPNVGSMLDHCLRRRPNIKPTLDPRLMFAGDERDMNEGFASMMILIVCTGTGL